MIVMESQLPPGSSSSSPKGKKDTDTEEEGAKPDVVDEAVTSRQDNEGARTYVVDKAIISEQDLKGLNFMKKVVARLKQSRNSWPFLQPIDPNKLDIQDYFMVIRKPMDLGTIDEWLDSFDRESSHYKSVEEVIADINLVWDNCTTYYKAEDSDYQCAVARRK